VIKNRNFAVKGQPSGLENGETVFTASHS